MPTGKAGSEVQYGPRQIGEVIADMLCNSNEPLAVAYRKRQDGETDGELFKGIFPNTEIGVDLKLMSREPGRMGIGEYRDGAITRDGEDHYTFIQNAQEKKAEVTQRNPHVYVGKRINVNRKDDGTLYPTFNRPEFNANFTFQDFCREAAEELLMVAGLVEEV